MKKTIHPEMREVIYQDIMTGDTFLIRSTQASGETAMWEDGKEYPVVKVEISSRSHPAFTGQEKVQATSTRAEQFNAKYEKRSIH